MGLDQYQAIFEKEQIDGAILLECDEGVLEHELGVAMRLHRIKLMRIITGKLSPESIIPLT